MNFVVLRLFSVSTAIMLLELICIRWIPAYVRLFGFFINFVLLGTLLGIGLGILSERRLRLPIFPIILLGLIVFVRVFQNSFHLVSNQVLFYGAEGSVTQHENFLLLPVIFLLVAFLFMPLGRILGDALDGMTPLRSYFVDILGSLTGIGIFVAMSYLSMPPPVWFCALALVSIPLIEKPDRLGAGSAFLGIILAQTLVSGAGDPGKEVWSPYYRIQYWHEKQPQDSYVFNVNNIGHQIAQPYQTREAFYFRPYDLLGRPAFKHVLIIGAGTGTDVSVALHRGVESVDAVEIDPQLYQLGRRLNSDNPYGDPRVHIHINDGRAFLRHTDAKYDLIIFALTDSLTLTSGYANLRLESFLFRCTSSEHSGQYGRLFSGGRASSGVVI
jgi:Spermine/spermidine synthase domain